MATHAHYKGEFGSSGRGGAKKIAKIEKIKAKMAKLQAQHAKIKASHAKVKSKADLTEAKRAKSKEAWRKKAALQAAKEQKFTKSGNKTLLAKLKERQEKHRKVGDKKRAMFEKKQKALANKAEKLEAKKLAIREKMNKLDGKGEPLKIKTKKEDLADLKKSKDDFAAYQKKMNEAAAAKKLSPQSGEKTYGAGVSEHQALKNDVYNAKKDVEYYKSAMEAHQKKAEDHEKAFQKNRSAYDAKKADEHYEKMNEHAGKMYAAKARLSDAEKKLEAHEKSKPAAKKLETEAVGKVSNTGVHKVMDEGTYNAHARSFADNLNASEKKAASEYTQHGDRDVNGFLRGDAKFPPRDPKRATKEYAEKLDSLFAKEAAVVPHDTIFFRGVDDKLAGKLVALKPGQSFTDYGFGSTSTKKGIAESFAMQNAGDGAVLHISVRGGQKALPLEKITKFPGEAEMLLPRGTTFTVTKVVMKPGGNHEIHVTIDDGGATR